MKRNVFLFTFANVFYNVCTWIITVMVVHLASFEQAGYLSLAMSVSSTCSTIALFNMRSFQVTDVKKEYLPSEYVTSRMLTSLLAIIICIIYSLTIKDAYQMLCINLYMILKVVEAVSDVFHGIFQLHDRYFDIFISLMLRGFGFVIGFAGGLILTKKLSYAILFMALIHLFVCIMFDIRNGRKLESIKPLRCSKHVMELIRKCIPLVVFLFVLSLINTMAKSVLSYCFGTEELGVYSSIASPTLIVQVFATVAFSPFLPRISELNLQRDSFRLQQILNKVYLAFAGLALVVNMGAVLLGKWGLRLLFGQEILANYYLFMPVVWVTILYSAVFVFSQIMVSFRKIKEIIIGVLGAGVIFISIVYLSMNIWGVNGASISQIITFLLLIPYMVFICEKHIKKELV